MSILSSVFKKLNTALSYAVAQSLPCTKREIAFGAYKDDQLAIKEGTTTTYHFSTRMKFNGSHDLALVINNNDIPKIAPYMMGVAIHPDYCTKRIELGSHSTEFVQDIIARFDAGMPLATMPISRSGALVNNLARLEITREFTQKTPLGDVVIPPYQKATPAPTHS